MSRSLSLASALVLAAVVVAFGATEAVGQTRVTTGDLRVIAVDETSAPLPGVRIALLNTETGVERAALTGQDGRAMASALAVGRYTMRAELDGFRPVTLDDITIELGTTSKYA